MRKEKEEKKKKGTLEKRKKRDGEGGADWLLTEGPIGKGAEHPQEKNFVPNGENKGINKSEFEGEKI